ncbi:mitotic spindle assembly checkpoint protein MAD1-like [Actinia tenebrosa]|uniref:Mitotic spindle assembly checkpoint protein MAD1 n=1 Tax=Actinia tenebrosa TaxID=6105 RepID=A0A6P8HLR6_ACTTE|nr:mitotic spindle assembly checkpoint protein MAD1-like [Actinia tenebrosa]
MNFLRTPDDSTAVVRIMGEFDQFLTDSEVSGIADPKLRLTFDDDTEQIRPTRRATKTITYQKPSRSLARSQSSSVVTEKDREKDVEIIKSHSKIAHLESQLYSMESSRKRARVEQDMECEIQRQELNKKSEKMEDLMKSVQYALDQEKQAKEQLSDIKKEYEFYKNKADKKIQNLQREKLKLSSEIEEVKEDNGRKQLDLRNALTRQEAENIIIQNKLDESEAKLETFKRRYSEASKQVVEIEELRNTARNATLRVKELEQQLSRQEDAASIAMTMQSQLSRYRELEKQNLKLEEDNRYYRETNESNLLLKEQRDSMAAKLKRAEERIKDLSILEFENEDLKKRIKHWEVEDASGNTKTASPVQLTHEIAKLQKSQVVLLEQQSDLKSSSQIHEAARQKAETELSAALKELNILQASESKHKELYQRLQRRLVLITAERDGFRRILNVFDNNLSANYDSQLRDRVQEAEERLASYSKHVEAVESEISQAKDQLASQKTIILELERQLKEEKSKCASRSTVSTATDNEAKAEIKRLKEENMKLAEQLEIYELRKEQMHIQGYYDPTKTKVLHFSMNPTSFARQKKVEEIEKLRKENDSLRLKIQALEGGKLPASSSTAADSLQTSPEISASTTKQVEEVKAQLSSSELRNQRLKEVFSKKIQEFREACYALTGYKIDVLRDKQYRLQSMYAERSSDDLLFESNSKGEMMLLETDFSSQVRDHIETYLRRMNSIPAFLSNVTLDLFSKQTTTIVIN